MNSQPQHKTVTLPDGATVNLQKLNRFQQEDAGTQADLASWRAVRKYRKNEDAYLIVLDTFTEQSQEDQAAYLADGGYLPSNTLGKASTYPAQAAVLHPLPPEPPESAEDEVRQAWQAAVEEARQQQAQAITAAYQAAYEAALALPEEERLQKCIHLFRKHEQAKVFETEAALETLVRAVRTAEPPHGYVFADADGKPDTEQVRMLDQETLDLLISAYVELLTSVVASE